MSKNDYVFTVLECWRCLYIRIVFIVYSKNSIPALELNKKEQTHDFLKIKMLVFIATKISVVNFLVQNVGYMFHFSKVYVLGRTSFSANLLLGVYCKVGSF